MIGTVDGGQPGFVAICDHLALLQSAVADLMESYRSLQPVSLCSVVRDVTIRFTEQMLQSFKQQSFEPPDRPYRLRLGEKR